MDFAGYWFYLSIHSGVINLKKLPANHFKKGKIKMKQQYPTFPTTIGKKGSMTSPEGDVDNFTIVDEVLKIQSNAPHKMICFQKISFEDGSFEFRLAYYIIGIKSKMKGKWIFGQFATLVSQEDLRVIIREAQQKKWF